MSTRADGGVSAAVTATASVPLSMSLTARTPVMWFSRGTGSSHTVCQMPVTAEYMMPPGRRVCFPRGCQPASVGSQTRTSNVCVLGAPAAPPPVTEFASPPVTSPLSSAPVMSSENGVCPPRCPPTNLPSSHTSAFQSTAPKCSSTRRPAHAAGNANSRRSHRTRSGPTVLPTPDSALSTQNGTRILPANAAGASTGNGAPAAGNAKFASRCEAASASVAGVIA